MTYSSFNPELHPQLKPYITEIQRLEPSGKLRIRNLDDTSLKYIRYQLYTWMRSDGVKPQYRIVSFPGELLILRRSLPSSVTITLERPPLASPLEELLELALGEDDPGALLRAKRDKGEITTEEMGTIITRLGEILQ